MEEVKAIMYHKQRLSAEIDKDGPDRDWHYFAKLLEKKVKTLMNWCVKNKIENTEVILALDNHINGSEFPLQGRIVEWATKNRYHVNDIREAVDIAIGDDGMRSNEVIEILEELRKK